MRVTMRVTMPASPAVDVYASQGGVRHDVWPLSAQRSCSNVKEFTMATVATAVIGSTAKPGGVLSVPPEQQVLGAGSETALSSTDLAPDFLARRPGLRA
jgi:hypothetical protein